MQINYVSVKCKPFSISFHSLLPFPTRNSISWRVLRGLWNGDGPIPWLMNHNLGPACDEFKFVKQFMTIPSCNINCRKGLVFLQFIVSFKLILSSYSLCCLLIVPSLGLDSGSIFRIFLPTSSHLISI